MSDYYDIIVRFPNKEMADEFCGQMSDGFGEGFCDFSSWRKKVGTTGKNNSDYEKVTTDIVAIKTPVFFVDSIFKI